MPIIIELPSRPVTNLLLESTMRMLFVPALLLLIAAGDAPQFQVDHPWARASAGNAKTGATYLTITNNGQPDRLIGASTPAATSAGLHETVNENGIMKMRPVQSIALDPGKPVTLKPSGYHLMLTGLNGVLKAGDSFPLTLIFERAPPITVTVKVEAMGGAALDHGHGAMPGMPGMPGH